MIDHSELHEAISRLVAGEILTVTSGVRDKIQAVAFDLPAGTSGETKRTLRLVLDYVLEIHKQYEEIYVRQADDDY